MPGRHLRRWSLLAAFAVAAAVATGAGSAPLRTEVMQEASLLSLPGTWHSALQGVLRTDLERLEGTRPATAGAVRLIEFLASLVAALAVLHLRRDRRALPAWRTSPWLARVRHGAGLRAPPVSALA